MASAEGFVPVMPAPPGRETNLVDTESCGPRLIAATCIVLTLATVSLAIRIWTRIFIARSFRLDDYLMVIASVLNVIMVAVVLRMLHYGLGKHMWDVSMSTFFPNFLKLNMVASVFYCAGTGFNKASVLLFYNRIFPSPRLHLVVWITTFVAVGYSTAGVFVNIFACRPVTMLWDPSIKGTCVQRTAFYRTIAALGIFTDFVVVAIPIPSLYRLQMPMRQKMAASTILAMGGFWGVSSIIRLVTLCLALTDPDATWSTVSVYIWCIVELNMGIMGGCVTALRPFVRRYFPRLLGSAAQSAPEDKHYPWSHPSQRFELFPRGQQLQSMDVYSHQSVMPKRDADNESAEYILTSGGVDAHM